MFGLSSKYKNNNHFFLRPDERLATVCNAPVGQSGVYLVYALKDGKVELIYIGSTGKASNTKQKGLKDKLVNARQFGEPRRKSWISKMQSETIDTLDIHWFVTFSALHKDCPKETENLLLQRFENRFGRLPKWNTEQSAR